MASRMKTVIKDIFSDRRFAVPILLFALMVFVNSYFTIGQMDQQGRSQSFPWNTQVLMHSGKPAHISKCYLNENEIVYGQNVRGICLQDDLVLFIFEDDINGGVQLLVYDVYGRYAFGYRMYIGGRSTMRVALSPCYEGILLFDYKEKEADRYPVIHLTPDGYYEEKWFGYTDDLGFGSEAYIDSFSDYELLDENGKYTIRNKNTLGTTAVFDFSSKEDR